MGRLMVDECTTHMNLQNVNIYIRVSNHSASQENQITFLTDFPPKSPSVEVHQLVPCFEPVPTPKELADSKKELTEKHEMLEKTTMLGTRLEALVHLGLMSSGSPRTNKLPFGLEVWRVRFIHLPKEQLGVS